MVCPMEYTREMASRQPNSNRIWKFVMRSTLDSFSGGRVEFRTKDMDISNTCSILHSVNEYMDTKTKSGE
jgi:hypothetical protein